MSTRIEGWNIALKSRNGSTIKVGKLIEYHGRLVYGYWTRAGARRYDLDAWGFRSPVLAHCVHHNVELLTLYTKADSKTYAISMDDVLMYGVAGKEDQYGPTLNVPVERFRLHPRVPGFIPDAIQKIVSSDERLPSEPEESDAQLSLFA